MAPLFTLLLLAPLVGEYLLGSLGFSQLAALPVMILLYGGGSVFVRELTRQSGRGWPTILALGVAYGIAEEGIATLTLFNPGYMGVHLLDRGYVPALGIAVPWTLYVISFHAVWSIAVPVALAESLFPARRLTPWVGKVGLCVMGAVFALGIAATGTFMRKTNHFYPTAAEMGVTVLVIAAVASAAFLLFKPRVPAVPAARGMRPWKMGLFAFVCGSLFHFVNYGSGSRLPTAAIVGIEVGLIAIALVAVARAARSPGWSAANNDALATGALLVYGWWGFLLSRALHGPSDFPFHCAVVGFFLVLLVVRHFRGAASAGA